MGVSGEGMDRRVEKKTSYARLGGYAAAGIAALLFAWWFVDTLLGSRSSPKYVASRQRDLAIERAQTFISQNATEPLTVQDVCQATAVSERTLQYAFLEHFGVTPKAYLKAIRLNGVRRELKNAEPDVTINQVAMRWGFWHMSQFAVDYRKHFGELPSQTLQQVVRSL